MKNIKFFFLGTIALFVFIALIGYFRNDTKTASLEEVIVEEMPIEIAIPSKKVEPVVAKEKVATQVAENAPEEVDQIARLFAVDSSKLPIVETLSYTSRVPWLQGRPAWIADYASYYNTSRHFIARSLNRKVDYFTQKVAPGDRFNVFKKDLNLEFHLLIDLSKAKLYFYYVDLDHQERGLLKTYSVGLGRVDAKRKSGCLTPIGKYRLGDKVAIYKPGTLGFFQEQKVEMIRIFGTRWVPFDEEIAHCTEAAKGYGIHGAPWVFDPKSGQLVEDRSRIGQFDSDGCVRLLSEDMEEIFSIVITKPTIVELVQQIDEVKLAGVEP